MMQYMFNLAKNRQRPVMKLNNGLKALLDTGAYFPIWTGSVELLTERLGAKFIKKGVPITGFGGYTQGDLYQATFDFGGLIFPEMHIVTNGELDVTFDFIVSATMLDGLVYQIDTVNHVLNVEVPDNESNVRNLRIIDLDGKLHVLCEG